MRPTIQVKDKDDAIVARVRYQLGRDEEQVTTLVLDEQSAAELHQQLGQVLLRRRERRTAQVKYEVVELRWYKVFVLHGRGAGQQYVRASSESAAREASRFRDRHESEVRVYAMHRDFSPPNGEHVP